MKTKTEEMYALMNPWRLFFKVAMPGMISMFAMSIYSIIEGAFIGQRLGEGAFAAVNIAMPLVMINFSLADLVGVGASVPISIALGKKDQKLANRRADNGARVAGGIFDQNALVQSFPQNTLYRASRYHGGALVGG